MHFFRRTIFKTYQSPNNILILINNLTVVKTVYVRVFFIKKKIIISFLKKKSNFFTVKKA